MAAIINVQEFNEKNSLADVLFCFLNSNTHLFDVQNDEYFTKRNCKAIIYKGNIFVNYKQIYADNFKIQNGDIIELKSNGVTFRCVKNVNFIYSSKKSLEYSRDNESGNIDNNVDESKNGVTWEIIDTLEAGKKIFEFMNEHLEFSSIDSLAQLDSKGAVCCIVCLLEQIPFDEVKNCSIGINLIDFLKERFVQSNLQKEIGIDKKKLSFSGYLIRSLIAAKKEKEKEITDLFNDIKFGLYDSSLNKIHQNYNRIISKETFSYLIYPLLDNQLINRIAIENLTKPITEAASIQGIEEKYLYYESNKEIYENYLKKLEITNEYTKAFVNDVPQYLFKIFKTICDTVDQKLARIIVIPTSKKYNFQNNIRSNQDIFLFVANQGDGLAKSIKIASHSTISFDFDEINVGTLKPKEKREITIPAHVRHDENFLPEMTIDIVWEETSGTIQKTETKVIFEVQDVSTPWDELKRQNPYSIQIIEDKDKLYGRDEIIEELKSNVLSSNIESYKIWGQKRVGKSSIVKTLKSIFHHSEDILIIYRSILGLRNPIPIKTLNDLGESICSEIIVEIENKIKSSHVRDNLRNVAIPTFDGSFYPLEKFISKLHSINENIKFILIIDEFDRINEEFFRATDLGEGFSGSIGKALNEKKYIGFILVGSENMPLLDRQGMNYNSYLEREVDTFKKETEYGSFKNIILGPVNPYISFSDEAIDLIFDVTNGNPYFTNLICKEIFKIALKHRDSYIDIHFVESAIELICKSSQKTHFEHFWGDGITEESDVKKERTTDIRRRILVSFSICSNANARYFPTKNDILKNFKYPEEYKIEKYEVENTITEFFNRKIFIEHNSSIRIKPGIFEMWLLGPGKTLMIEGVSDLEALHREIELEREYELKPEELKRLSENLMFCDRSISIATFMEFFKQFGNSIEQRKIFNLLDSIFYISKDSLTDFFRKEQKNIFSKRDIQLNSRAHIVYKEGVEIYSFSETLEENRQLIDLFKLMNRIRPAKTIKNIKTEADFWKKSDADEIIIIEPVIDDTEAIVQELSNFMSTELLNSNIPVRLVTLLITTKAKTNLIKLTSTYANFKIIIYKEVEETKIKPFIKDTEIFENIDEANQAFATVRKKFPAVNRESSILVLFNSICPSKSCPILWYQSPQFKPLFYNEFGKLSDDSIAEKNSEERRTRIFHANRVLAQKMNFYIVKEIRAKAIIEGKDEWFDASYIPKSVMQSVSSKWIDEGTKNPIETYFDFSDYKKIIEMNKELMPIFNIPGHSLQWMDKLNILRRDPAHPEKPAPKEEEVDYFEKIRDKVLENIDLYSR